MDKFYICKTKYTDPYTNLALEKYLTDTCKDGVILFLWQNDNTVVIGTNQNPWSECRCDVIDQSGGRIARRRSGGGAVYHDLGNLNFSFICKKEDYDLEKNLQVIAKACNYAGIRAEISGRNDILAEGRKFSGNAFMTKDGISLHHGTVLIDTDLDRMKSYLSPSKAKLESKGIKSVRSRVVNLKELSPSLTVDKMSEHMIRAFENVFGAFSEIPLPDSRKISKDKAEFESYEYIFGKTFPFTAEVSGRVTAGDIRILLNIESGRISALRVYTDSMDETLAQRLQNILTDCPFEKNEIRRKLPAELCEIADLF